MSHPRTGMRTRSHAVVTDGRPTGSERSELHRPLMETGRSRDVVSPDSSTTVATLPEAVDVLIVGAGHAGLTMSGLLTQAGREHLVVERRDRLGGGWQDRWDEFTLVSPNWTSSFPGWAYDGPDPDGS
jgi:hypothetical protein